MSIRLRIMLICLSVVAVAITCNLVIQQILLNPSFEELEHIEADRNMQRCVQALVREVKHLDQFCSDWAAWDDTYAYIYAPDKAYENSNLVDSTFYDNSLNLLYLVDNSGNVLWGATYDLENETYFDMPDFPKRPWGARHPLLNLSTDKKLAGILLTSRGLMLIASNPILTSNMKGPVRGAMIMGRFLNASLVQALIEQTQVHMHIRPLDNSVSADTLAKTPRRLDELISGYSRKIEKDWMHVYAVLPDIHGNPGFVLCADLPREITAKGNTVVHINSMAISLAGLFALLILLALMRRTVISPLSKLTAHVSQIGESGTLSTFHMGRRNDEFGVLSKAFNHMVRRLREDSEERNKAEEAVRESEERFQSLLASLNDVVWSSSLDTRTLYYINPAAETVYGHPMEDFIKNPQLRLDLVHPDYQEQVANSMRQAQQIGKSEVEYLIQRSDGALRWLHGRLTLIRNAEGQPYRLAGVTTDITQLKRLSEKVLENQHLAELGEMGASLAHEIRNPLAGISGVIQVIQNTMDAENPHYDLIEEALAQISRVEATVKQLLRFAKCWHVEKRPSDLANFLDAICTTHRQRPENSAWTYTLNSTPPLPVAFDPTLLEQVMENLLQNAAQAMPQGGKIQIIQQEKPEAAIIRICDNGPGIPQTVQPHLFEPFYTTKTRGSGLGLSICRRIVEAHGGTIEGRNRPEGGAEFLFTLPKE